MSNKKFELMVTPAGVAVYPRLTKPDTKFNPDGEFKLKLRLAEEDAAKVIAKIDAIHKENVAAVLKQTKKKPKDATPPYSEVYDDEGNPTGEVEFNFKRKATIRMKDGTTFEGKVDLVDAKKNPFPKDKSIYGGSVVKVAAELVPFATAIGAGVSLRLKAVQVIKLVEGSGGSGAANAFDEEDGFEAEASGSDFESADAPEDNEDF